MMEQTLICQSCTMPIDNIESRGTEKDGSVSRDYCRYCYRNGAFINPGMTKEEMKVFIVAKMRAMGIPDEIINRSVNYLPHLKRWQQVKPL